MAFNEEVGNRLRVAFEPYPEVIEKKMFGGLAFMVQGHMCCGVNGDELMVRVGPDGYEEALAAWVERAADFVLSQPPK